MEMQELAVFVTVVEHGVRPQPRDPGGEVVVVVARDLRQRRAEFERLPGRGDGVSPSTER
ncbi:hypothetical protein ACIOD2_02085 [Amycolatopsis sp. NPDC088138]|uniref:hypothetical protein n=1 Tax=Amycolatopsis sp. NPDC088138 TaxID=3363938 RepID=UPI00381CE5E9